MDDLAKKAGIHWVTIARLEKGKLPVMEVYQKAIRVIFEGAGIIFTEEGDIVLPEYLKTPSPTPAKRTPRRPRYPMK